MERHANILYTLVVFLLIFQITTFVFVTIQFSRISSQLDFEIDRVETNLSSKFTNLVTKYNEEYQRNFNELSIALTQQAEQQRDFEKDIQLIKTSPSDFSDIVQKALRSVVSVLTESSMGSGFVVNSEGYIVTNYHVIESADNVKVLTYNKKIMNAEIIGVDKLRDLALLRINAEYDYLTLADSNELQIGRRVVAIGNPLGLSFTVTEGIISALDREGPNGIEEYIQTDVSLNPGNSGGPLIDTTGKVIGINNFKIGGAESLGFALESNSIKESVNGITGKRIIL